MPSSPIFPELPDISNLRTSDSFFDKYKKLIVPMGGVLLVGSIGFAAFTFLSGPPEGPAPEKIRLEFWDAYDSENVYRPLIEKYEAENPNVDIIYSVRKPDTSFQKPEETYRDQITRALASGEGPDIYTIQNTWVPMERSRLSAINEVKPDVNTALLLSKYPDVVRFDLTWEEETGTEDASKKEEWLYALPLSIDTLALYYNADHLQEAGVAPPKTWEEFTQAVRALTRTNEEGKVTRAGAAIGSSDTHTTIQGGDNISNAFDILSLMMIQTGTRMNDEASFYTGLDQPVGTEEGRFYPGRNAFEFYTSFSIPGSENYAWDPDGPYSLDAFIQGNASMMINYQRHEKTIKDKNPFLNYAITTTPQPKENFSHVSYGSYWALAVAERSEYKEAAWDFILFLAEEGNNRTYLERSNRPPALRSFVPEWRNKPNMDVFARQILTARSWLQPNPFETEKVVERVIKDLVLKEDAHLQALVGEAAIGINSLWIELNREGKPVL